MRDFRTALAFAVGAKVLKNVASIPHSDFGDGSYDGGHTMLSIPTSYRAGSFVGSKQIKIVEKPTPTPGTGQLVLKVGANAICGSERPQFFDGTATTPGHEAAGTVVAAGTGTHTPVGTPGVVFLMDFCGKCRSCKLGFTNQCLSKRGDMGFNKDGGYGQYQLINENIFFPAPGFTATEATLLLDIMGTGGHAIERCQLMRPDIESVLVLGAGPIGLGVLAMAKIILGRHVNVFLTDIVPYRLKLAEQLGGLPINASKGSIKDGLKVHGSEAADMGVDTSGKQVAREEGHRALAQRGSLICVGHGEGISLKISPDIIAPERSVVGSEYFRYDELPANLRRLTAHKDYISQIITHRYGLDEIQKAFDLFFGGETGKVIIEQ
ncbi:MAG TPA: alcohol dehydrogenase catalytic domain-containing protein [Verrucomicrobiae bacterium]|nr:alcohol dehydrogenase catalytic domain-containing protein [Verrucomicrobiae bacterium]